MDEPALSRRREALINLGVDIIPYAGHVPETDTFDVAWGPDVNSSDFPLFKEIIKSPFFDAKNSFYIRSAPELRSDAIEIAGFRLARCVTPLHI